MRSGSEPAPHRGEVWLAELDKVRPVVVLSRDPMGQVLHSVVIGPVTSTVRGLSTEVAVGPDDGVRRESVVNLDNLQLLPRTRLRQRVGRLRPQVMDAVCVAAIIAIGCDG